MKFINNIKLLENPPTQFQVEGALWVDSGKIKHLTYPGDLKTIAYEEDIPLAQTFIYQSTFPMINHVITHNLNSRTLIPIIQINEGGFPGEYVLAEMKPTSGNELNSVTVVTDDLVDIFVTLIKI